MLTEKYYQDLSRSIQETADMIEEAKKFLSSYEQHTLKDKLLMDAETTKNKTNNQLLNSVIDFLITYHTNVKGK
jgi:hypothetical protein